MVITAMLSTLSQAIYFSTYGISKKTYNLFFDIWHFKEDLLCYLLEYPNS